MRGARVLFERALARLVSRRIVLACLVCAFFALLITMALVAYQMPEELSGDDRPAALRRSFWGEARGFFDLFQFILAITLGCGLLAGELRDGTIFSILARPVSRRTVFLAAWSGAALMLLGLEALRVLLAFGLYAALGGDLDAAGVLGASSLMLDSLLMFTLFAALGAALPAALACVTGIVIISFQGLSQAPFVTGTARTVLRVLATPFPSWASSSLVEAAALRGDGVSLLALLEVHAYRGAWIALLLLAGSWLFSRRELAPRI